MRASLHILRRAALVFLAVVIGLGAYHLSASGLARNRLPMPFGLGLATVESNSMVPALRRGDLLVVRELADDAALAVGDVVVYEDADVGFVVHRVVSLDGDLVTTQGDANNAADAPFDRSLVVGRVAAVFPTLGFVVAALRTPVGMIAVLMAAIALVELPFARRQESDEAEREALRAQIAALRAADARAGGVARAGAAARASRAARPGEATPDSRTNSVHFGPSDDPKTYRIRAPFGEGPGGNNPAPGKKREPGEERDSNEQIEP